MFPGEYGPASRLQVRRRAFQAEFPLHDLLPLPHPLFFDGVIAGLFGNANSSAQLPIKNRRQSRVICSRSPSANSCPCNTSPVTSEASSGGKPSVKAPASNPPSSPALAHIRRITSLHFPLTNLSMGSWRSAVTAAGNRSISATSDASARSSPRVHRPAARRTGRPAPPPSLPAVRGPAAGPPPACRRNDSSRTPRRSAARRANRSRSLGLVTLARIPLTSAAERLLPSRLAPWRSRNQSR